MAFVRRHLRHGVLIWLVCHAATFSALLPRDCCAAHAHDGRARLATAEEGCPMHDQAPASAACAFSGSCQAPDAALAAVLLQAAVIEPIARPLPQTSSRSTRHLSPFSARSLASPPDAPPPRA